ncbi:hypothetical protein F5X98DRAFT_29554 [Xylaria grammica]|nr:hypothetical protein F5X98DRAFT_29554 [Xylaria grammica]
MERSLVYELAFWVAIVAASSRYNLYYTVTSLSLFVTRLHLIWWPFARFAVVPRSILLGLLIWCYFLTPAHVFTFTLMDLWAPYSVYPPFNPIEIVHDAGENAVVDVFAIHGLGSNPASAWAYRDNGTEIRWLKDVLPKEPGFVNIRVVMVNHQTKWNANTADASFEEHAEMILRDVESVYKSGKNRPIIFIAHSFGGLLLKRTLLLAKLKSSPVAAMTRGILFLGVPHSGTGVTFFASLLSCTAYWRGSSTTLLEYMTPGSEHLMSLETDFYNTYAHPHSSHPFLPYICDFQEMRPERLGTLDLGPTVDRNAGRSSHGNVVKLDTDHRGLNKFRSTQDPNFRRFSRQFAIAFEAATHGKKFGRSRDITEPSHYPDPNPEEYDIPFQLDLFRNDKFTGRVDALERLHKSLGHHKEHSRLDLVVLQGIGGIGKTELALEYAYSHQKSYSSVFWVDCSTENSARHSFLQIANRLWRYYVGKAIEPAALDRLGLQEVFGKEAYNMTSNGRALKAVEAVKNWFAENSNRDWLLIFDNLDDPETVNIMDYIPRTAWGSIIITSRRRGLLSYGTVMEIPEMNPGEGLPFLAKISRFRRELNSCERQRALQLLQLLEYLPLAIEQAGAYISQRIPDDFESCCPTLEDYLDLYQRNARMLLQYKRSSIMWSNRNDTVLTTWEVSFDAVKKESPEASDLLLLCGFLADNDIFEEMFRLGRKLPENDTTFQESASKLSSYSLVKFKGGHGSFSIHPLVKYWARERLPLDVQQRLANHVIQLILRGLNFKREEGSHEYTSFERRIIPHLDNAVENIQGFLRSSTTQAGILPPSSSVTHGPLSTVYEIAEGWYLWAYGIITDISVYYHHYLHSDFEPFGEWQLAYKLGDLYRGQGLYQRAERMYLWAFTDACERLHIQHPKTLEIAGDLAWEVFSQGRYDDATNWYNWLLVSRKKVLGKEHPSTLGATKGLAAILRKTGDGDLALRFFFEALAGRQKKLGENDVLTINVMNDIANVYHDQGIFDEAIHWHQRVLSARQKTLGENHETTVATMYRIATIFGEQGQYDKALVWHEQSMARDRMTAVGKHKYIVGVMSNFADICQDRGELDDALRWHYRILSLQRKALGESHKKTLGTMDDMASILDDQGKYDESLPLHQQILAWEQVTLGQKHETTLYRMTRIAIAFWQSGKLDMALNLFYQVLAGRQETLGKKHRDTLKTTRSIGSVLRSQGKYTESLRWHEQALAGQQETLGQRHQDTLETIHNIGVVYCELNRDDIGLDWFYQAFYGQRETLGEKHKDTLMSMGNIGVSYEILGNYDMALDWFYQTLAGQRETLGEEHEATQRTRLSITRILERQDIHEVEVDQDSYPCQR